MFEAKVKEMGIQLPPVVKPVAAYVPVVRAGEFLYISGQLPMVDGELKYTGQMSPDRPESDGYEAAKICAINCLSAIKSITGSLDKVEQIVKLTGFVSSVPEYPKQPQAINGASELLLQIFGEAGAHSRSAVGVSGLPLNALVELEMIVKLSK